MTDFKIMVMDRMPGKEDIELICYPQVDDSKNFINVAFVFPRMVAPRDAFYTHFYLGDIEKYINYKIGKGI
jgi:hypothetical protein